MIDYYVLAILFLAAVFTANFFADTKAFPYLAGFVLLLIILETVISIGLYNYGEKEVIGDYKLTDSMNAEYIRYIDDDGVVKKVDVNDIDRFERHADRDHIKFYRTNWLCFTMVGETVVYLE